MFHYITHPVEALLEMERVLRPGGAIVLTDWCDDYIACRVCNLYLRLTNRAFYKTYHQTECLDLLHRAGFGKHSARPLQDQLALGADDRGGHRRLVLDLSESRHPRTSAPPSGRPRLRPPPRSPARPRLRSRAPGRGL